MEPKCNICGKSAVYLIRLERATTGINVVKGDTSIPFYVCETHRYVYEKMKDSIALTKYFDETTEANQ